MPKLAVPLIVALAGLPTPTPVPAPDRTPEIARGVVYEDRDADGRRDAGEPGLPGVLVSNGREIAQTDADGAYELPAADDTILFVIKPRGFRTALDERNLPRFFYVHKPDGSPDEGFRYPGSEPTGPLPESVDFGLIPQEEPESFTVLVFGDTQPYTLEEVDYVARDVLVPLKEQGAHGAAFVISLGDLVGDDLSLFEPLNEAQALLGLPFYNVIGNHDMNFMAGHSDATASDPDRYSDETYEATYGPATYAFAYGGAHFIVLDDVVWHGYKGLRKNGRPVNSNYTGGLREDQLAFVAAYLEHVPEDELVVLSMHIPFAHGEQAIARQGELLGLLSGRPHTLSLSGHTHIQEHLFFGSADGYVSAGGGQNGAEHHHLNSVTVSGSWWRGVKDEQGIPVATMACGAPNGYTLLHVEGNRYRSEFRAARAPAEHQMTIWLPEGMDTSGAGGEDLVVNVFNGSERSRTRFRVLPFGEVAGATEWRTLARSEREDPYYLDQKSREEANPGYRPLPKPRKSGHVFAGRMPEGLPAGVHVLEVESTDLYGQTVRGQRHVRVR